MSLYFLAFIPSESIQQEVKILKGEIRLKYAAKHAQKLPAHITLQPPFRLFEEDKVSFLEMLTKFAEREVPLEIQLSGFGSFPPRVIYIDVENKKPIIAFQRKLQDTLANVLDVSHTVKSDFHPHITLATRDLKEEYYPEAWDDFQKRKYLATFTASSLYLLQHKGKAWEIYSEFAIGKEKST